RVSSNRRSAMTTTEFVYRTPDTAAVSADDLTILANKIKAAHAAVGTALQHAVEAGHLLIRAKRLIPHGGWSPWVRENCALSERTARAYMQLASNVGDLVESEDSGGEDEPNRQRVAGLSVRRAAKKLAKPKASKSTGAAEIVKPDAVERSA